MLAPLLLLGLVLGYEACDKVPSCTLQVNGTRPKSSIISTLPNGGAGYTFTTTDCIRGLIGITEPCQCRNSTMYTNPGFCYFSGNYSQPEASDMTHFCKNQNGENTFSVTNSTSYMTCYCYDPATGNKEAASIRMPFCKNGRATYVPCSTDGKNDNAALLGEYPTAKKAAISLLHSGHPYYFVGFCKCGRNNCADTEQYNYHHPYCQSEVEYCSEYPACDVDKVFKPKDLYQQRCQCGFSICLQGEKCQTKVVDGMKKYVCTFNGGSSNAFLMIKKFSGEMTVAFVFGIVSFVCILFVILFWILSCLKINQAAKVASTNIQSQ